MMALSMRPEAAELEHWPPSDRWAFLAKLPDRTSPSFPAELMEPQQDIAARLAGLGAQIRP